MNDTTDLVRYSRAGEYVIDAAEYTKEPGQMRRWLNISSYNKYSNEITVGSEYFNKTITVNEKAILHLDIY